MTLPIPQQKRARFFLPVIFPSENKSAAKLLTKWNIHAKNTQMNRKQKRKTKGRTRISCYVASRSVSH
jgi:hypothetical protein